MDMGFDVVVENGIKIQNVLFGHIDQRHAIYLAKSLRFQVAVRIAECCAGKDLRSQTQVTGPKTWRRSCQPMLEVESSIFRAQRRISLAICATKGIAFPLPSVPARLCCKPAATSPRFKLRPVETVTGNSLDHELALYQYVWMKIQGHRHAKRQRRP